MSAIELMIEVIREHSPPTKWTGAPLEEFRRVDNTNRGEIGEHFLRRYLVRNGMSVSSESRTDPTDLIIENRRFEVKTASEDVGGNFQFNHVRLDRRYDYLLCLGISPSSIWFNAWRKGEVAEERAGSLVRMAEGQSVTFKLTKRLADMRPIEALPEWVRTTLADES
ncbi:MAG: hypothetical protein F4017_02765 [Acidimicrobiaceae bacterium]|nr:hypothetical protein [Acidimicrobiaceae bacterium]MYE96782.1 hypothetical protein [Acidimicrobiaceae bacterium]MYH42496.1 hypothetical protein [Acidimicrobiaceae bacterium]MYJ80834.1 hypothetical protein [Acidimicrobiaceae bacterium]MYK73507.1 hypothetical protein [Acidimicrobiaceae bacterium]